jgi:competence protein ComGC
MYILIKFKNKKKAQLSIEFILYLLIIIIIILFFINIETKLQEKYINSNYEEIYLFKLNYLKERYFIKNNIYEYKNDLEK